VDFEHTCDNTIALKKVETRNSINGNDNDMATSALTVS